MNFLKQKKRDIFIVISSLFIITISSLFLFASEKIVSVNQMMLNQQFVFDATFNDEEAVKQIQAPKKERRNFISASSLHYNYQNIKPGEDNYGYFVFPITGLNANSNYILDLEFNFYSNNDKQQELLLDVVDQEVLQSPSSQNTNQIISNIDITKIQARQFVLPGINDYTQRLEFSSNEEGRAWLVIGLDINDSQYIDFWLNGLRLNIKEEIVNDNITNESQN